MEQVNIKIPRKEQERSEKHRRLNTGSAILGSSAAGLTAYGAYKGKKRLGETMDKVDSLIKNADSAVKSSPLNRTRDAKRFRRQEKIKRKQLAQKKKPLLRRMKRAQWPKWRKALNKLPGGKKYIFENPVLQRSAEKTRAKLIAMNFDALTPYQEDSGIRQIKEHRKMYRRQTNNFRKARTAVEGGKDIKDAIKGERRNKRRKRFWEKKPFQDRAMAAGLTVGGAGLAALAGSKYGRKIFREELSENATNIELDAVSTAILNEVSNKKKGKGWRMSRPTSSSVRVHTSGKRRNRRKKHWHERTSNRNKMLAGAAITGAAGTGLGIYQLLRGKKLKGINKTLTRRLERVKERSLARNKKIKDLQRKPIGTVDDTITSTETYKGKGKINKPENNNRGKYEGK